MSDPVIDRTMAVRIATQLGWEPKREWVGLDTSDFNDFNPYFKAEEAARWAERKLKEKNT
jgi:hypothetical protein